jgi:thioredoxin 1
VESVPSPGREAGVVEIVGEAQFDELVLGSEKVAVVDFWAPWCGPCRVVSPIIEELASEYAGRAVFAKVNVDQNRALAVRYQTQFIPTIIYFKGGKAVDQVVGARDKSAYKELLDKHLP